ncbi:hypothetical protein HK098_000542 [Nowakowskiella sp. JEL0407]|nr:hypothetical protein HK098_000542 [Nowakowskiella sp. JEL0407]
MNSSSSFPNKTSNAQPRTVSNETFSDLSPINSNIHSIATNMRLAKHGIDHRTTSTGRSRVITRKITSESLPTTSTKHSTEPAENLAGSVSKRKNENDAPKLRSSGRMEVKRDYQYIPPAAAKYFLWDSSPTGSQKTSSPSSLSPKSIQIHSSSLQKLISANSRRGPSPNSNLGFLIGRFVSDILFLDRFDGGRVVSKSEEFVEVVPTLLVSGDVAVSVFGEAFTGDGVVTKSHYLRAFKTINRTHSWGETLTDLVNSFPLCCVYADSNKTITFRNIVPAQPIQYTPIHPLRLVSTLLTNELILKGDGVEFGYAAIDQARQVLPVRSSDTRLRDLPLVGIYAKNLDTPTDPLIHKFLLRFKESTGLKKMSDTNKVLLVLFPPPPLEIRESIPKFFECNFGEAETECPFSLFGSEDVEVSNNGDEFSAETVDVKPLNMFLPENLEFLRAVEEYCSITLIPKSPPKPAITSIERELPIEPVVNAPTEPEETKPDQPPIAEKQPEEETTKPEPSVPNIMQQLLQSLQQPSTGNNALLIAAAAMIAASANSPNPIPQPPQAPAPAPTIEAKVEVDKKEVNEISTQTSMVFFEPKKKDVRSVAVNTSIVYQSPYVVKSHENYEDGVKKRFVGTYSGDYGSDVGRRLVERLGKEKVTGSSTTRNVPTRINDYSTPLKYAVNNTVVTGTLFSKSVKGSAVTPSVVTRSEVQVCDEPTGAIPEGSGVPYYVYEPVSKVNPLEESMSFDMRRSVLTSVSRQVERGRDRGGDDGGLEEEEGGEDEGMLTLSFLESDGEVKGKERMTFEKSECEKRIYIPAEVEEGGGGKKDGEERSDEVKEVIGKFVESCEQSFVVRDDEGEISVEMPGKLMGGSQFGDYQVITGKGHGRGGGSGQSSKEESFDGDSYDDSEDARNEYSIDTYEYMVKYGLPSQSTIATELMDVLDSLTDNQKDLLATFQNVTGIDDIEASIKLLSLHDWNLELSVQSSFEERFGEQENYNAGSSSSSSAPFMSQNTASNSIPKKNNSNPDTSSSSATKSQNNSSVPASGAIQRQIPGVFDILFLPVTIGLKIVSALFSFALSLLSPLTSTPAPAGTSASRRRANATGASDPKEAAARFLLDFESFYGRLHPDFFQGTYQQAIELAKREIRYCLIYLHSEEHDDTEEFCKNTISSERLTTWLREKNIVVWAGDIRESEAYKVCTLLNVTRFPFLALIASQGSRPAVVIERFEGVFTAEKLIEKIGQHMTRLDPQMFAIKSERTRQAQARSIREQQDEAYQQSLLADQEKARKQKEEKERLETEKREEEERLAKIKEEEERLEREILNIKQRKLDRKAKLLRELEPEPEQGVPEVSKISIRLPNGERLVRRFPADYKIEKLYDFIETQQLDPIPIESEFVVVNTYPRKEFRELSLTFKEAGLYPNGAIVVEEDIEEDDEE